MNDGPGMGKMFPHNILSLFIQNGVNIFCRLQIPESCM